MSPETQLAIRDYSMFLGYHHVMLNLDRTPPLYGYAACILDPYTRVLALH